MNISRLKRREAGLLAALSAVFLVGCYPDQITSVQDLDVVATQYDTEYAFSANGTWAMPDSIAHVCDFVDVDGCIELRRDLDDEILAKVAAEMAALGYTRIPTDQINPGNVPDVVLLTSALGTRTTVIYSWYPGWGWWGGWGWCPGCWGPGWGWGYPPVGVTSYESGSLIVSMVDPDLEPEEEEMIPTPWLGVLNGLLQSGTPASRIDDGLTQMFAQSPYLRAGN